MTLIYLIWLSAVFQGFCVGVSLYLSAEAKIIVQGAALGMGAITGLLIAQIEPLLEL